MAGATASNSTVNNEKKSGYVQESKMTIGSGDKGDDGGKNSGSNVNSKITADGANVDGAPGADAAAFAYADKFRSEAKSKIKLALTIEVEVAY